MALHNLEHFPLVVSLQEAHAGSKHLSLHWVLHWREDQGPLGGCVSTFRRTGQQSRMRLKTLQVGSPLYKIASEALQFGKSSVFGSVFIFSGSGSRG